jgi:hypothetical protein
MVKVSTQQNQKNYGNSVLTVQSIPFSSFSVLTARIRLDHKQEKHRGVSFLSNSYLNSLIQ